MKESGINTVLFRTPHSALRTPPLVIDPVMVATSGARLLKPSAIKALTDELFPLAAIITPNLDGLASERLRAFAMRLAAFASGDPAIHDAANAEATAATLRASGESVYTIGSIAPIGSGAAVVVA